MRRLLAGSLFGRNCWISMVIACPHFLELSPISLNKLIMIILPVMYRLHHMFLTFPKKDPKRNAGRIPTVYDFSPAIRCCCAPVFNSYHSLHLDSLSKSHRSQLSCQFKLTWHPLLQYRKPWLCNVTGEQNHWWQPHVATIVFFPFSIGCYLKMQKKMVKSFIMFLSWNGHKIRVNPATAAPFTTSMAPSRAASLASCSGNPIRPRLGQPVEVPLADTSWHMPGHTPQRVSGSPWPPCQLTAPPLEGVPLPQLEQLRALAWPCCEGRAIRTSLVIFGKAFTASSTNWGSSVPLQVETPKEDRFWWVFFEVAMENRYIYIYIYINSYGYWHGQVLRDCMGLSESRSLQNPGWIIIFPIKLAIIGGLIPHFQTHQVSFLVMLGRALTAYQGVVVFPGFSPKRIIPNLGWNVDAKQFRSSRVAPGWKENAPGWT